MPKTPLKRKSVRPAAEKAAEKAREKALREKYQHGRPTLADLEASGEYEPSISQGEYWNLMKILASPCRLRQEAGLSLADMERRTGMDRAALSRLENAVNDNPSIQTLGRYADALGKRLVVKFVNAPARRAGGRKRG